MMFSMPAAFALIAFVVILAALGIWVGLEAFATRLYDRLPPEERDRGLRGCFLKALRAKQQPEDALSGRDAA